MCGYTASARTAGCAVVTFDHEHVPTNLLHELEELFRTYAQTGRGRTRDYAHDDADARALGVAPGQFRGIGGCDLAALGIPDERAYVKRYCERTGRPDPDAVMADWNFYLAYNLFRMAGILQGIAKRVVEGTASSAQATSAGAGARPLAEMGWRIAQSA